MRDVKERKKRGGEAAEWLVGEKEVEQIAARVVELLGRERRQVGEGLIDAAEAARRLGVSRGTVYEKAEELGAVRLGEGPRARLRFDPARLAACLGTSGVGRQPLSEDPPIRRQVRVRQASRVDLLPVRGRVTR